MAHEGQPTATMVGNPADHTEGIYYPDWNSATGTGVPPDSNYEPSMDGFDSLYASAKDGEKARLEGTEPEE